MYCHNWEEYSVNKGKNDDDFQIILYKIMKKNEQCWNLVARNEIKATQIIEKKLFSGLQNLIDVLVLHNWLWNMQ